jgi:hypothetical protein
MREKIRILVLSTNPWTSTRIVVDDEAKQICERLHEGPYRGRFQLHNHAVLSAGDLQKLLLMYEPHIVHFSGNGSQLRRLLLGSMHGRGHVAGHQGLANLFALYRSHVRLVLLNSCFTTGEAQSISEVVNYSIGAGKAIGGEVRVTFAGAFYRALGFGKSVRTAFASAKAELALTRTPRSRAIELFVRHGVSERDRFPQTTKPARRRNRRYRCRSGATVSTRLRQVAR